MIKTDKERAYLKRSPQNPLKERRPIPGRFKVGEDYPERVATQFPSQNYRGYPSREAWSASFKESAKRKKIQMSDEKRKLLIKKEARDIQDIARDLSEEMIELAADIARDENTSPAAKLQAIQFITERGYGKPVQSTVNTNINQNLKPSELNATELDQRVAETLRRIEGAEQRAPKAPEGENRPRNLREYN